MKKFFKKITSFFPFKKKQPWYKRYAKKCLSFLDMKRKNKFIVFFGLLFVAIFITCPSFDNIVKQLVHEYGSKFIGTNVSISGVDFKPTSGYAAVKDIKIANPKDYKSKNLFYLKELDVQINISTLTDTTIVVDSIKVNNPEITYEMLSLTQNNISDILNNIKQNTASADQEKTVNKDKSSSDKKNTPTKKVIIKTLAVNNGKINIMAGVGNLKKELSLPLPKIEMHNIGQEKNGASIGDTISLVISKILQTASQTVISTNMNDLKNSAEKEFKNLTANLKDGSDKATENIKKGLKDLLNVK